MYKSFDIDCELNYQVHAPSTFIFKIEAALTPQQSISNETLSVALRCPGRVTDALGTRTLRINAAPGPLQRALSRHGGRAGRVARHAPA